MECEQREDRRNDFIVTIDPDDAKDFDDAIHVERLGNSGWRLQVHIAQEETKFGFDETEIQNLELKQFANVRIKGLMGMASLTDDLNKIRIEFKSLKTVFDKLKTQNLELSILSMGMSADYKIAIEEGSNMVRIGSLLFGERNY